MIGSQAEMESHTALITSLVGMTSCQTETVHCVNALPAVRLYWIETKLAPEGSLFSQIHQMMPCKDEVHLCAGGRAAAVFSGMCSTVQLSWIKVWQRGEESEDENTETWLRSSFVWCTDTISNVSALPPLLFELLRPVTHHQTKTTYLCALLCADCNIIPTQLTGTSLPCVCEHINRVLWSGKINLDLEMWIRSFHLPTVRSAAWSERFRSVRYLPHSIIRLVYTS